MDLWIDGILPSERCGCRDAYGLMASCHQNNVDAEMHPLHTHPAIRKMWMQGCLWTDGILPSERCGCRDAYGLMASCHQKDVDAEMHPLHTHTHTHTHTHLAIRIMWNQGCFHSIQNFFTLCLGGLFYFAHPRISFRNFFVVYSSKANLNYEQGGSLYRSCCYTSGCC